MTMQIPSSIPRLASLPNLAAEATTKSTSAGSEHGFAETLKDVVGQIDSAQQAAHDKISNLLGGNGQDVHGAMISVEQANLSFELMMQVRNKMVSAYQEIERLQF